MNELEARYRWLLAAYPSAHRHEREDEMVSVLLDVARPGQTRPSLRQATAIVAAGLTYRLRSAAEWQAGAAIAGVVALGLGVAMAVLTGGISLLRPATPNVESGLRVGLSAPWWVPTAAWTVALVLLAAAPWLKGRRSVVGVSLIVVFALILALGGSHLAGFTRSYTVPFACFLVLSMAAAGAPRWSQVTAFATGSGFGGLLLLRFVDTYGRDRHWDGSPVRLWEHVSRWSLSNDLVVIRPGHCLVVVVAGLLLGLWRPRIAVAVGLLAVPLAMLAGGPNAAWSGDPKMQVLAAIPTSILLLGLAIGVGWARRSFVAHRLTTGGNPQPFRDDRGDL